MAVIVACLFLSRGRQPAVRCRDVKGQEKTQKIKPTLEAKVVYERASEGEQASERPILIGSWKRVISILEISVWICL